MKSLEEFLPQILPYAPGCPVPVAYDHIRSAAIRFCEATRMWRDTDTVTIESDGSIIVVPDGVVLYEIESAKHDGAVLTPISISELDAQIFDWESLDSGLPKYITQSEPNSVRVVPHSTGTLTLSLFVKPSEDAEELPDWMVDQYRRVIADGALSEILILPGQNFTDPARASFFENRFMRELDRLSTQNIRGQQRASVRTVAQFM